MLGQTVKLSFGECMLKSILFLMSLVFLGTTVHSEERPLVILLNGTSSAGKSSIAEKIQKLSEKPILHVGFDHFCLMLPRRYLFDGEEAHLGYKFVEKPGPKTTVDVGPVGDQMTLAMHKAMRALLDSGFDLVIDEVLVLDKSYQDYLELFQDCRLFVVGIKPPVEIAEQREISRGDRVLGLARGLFEITHLGKVYDLEIDSSKHSPEESARQILDFIDRGSDQ